MTQDQIQKLGNSILYLSKNVEDPSKTKILKLVYLLEEESVKRFSSPFFGFTFYAWQFGPVHEESWENLLPEAIAAKTSIFSEFISVTDRNGTYYFHPTTEFSDDEFSDNDIEILEFLVEKYRYADASNLVNITHKDGSLWKNTVLKEDGLLERLESGRQSRSELKMDFSELLIGDSQKEFLNQGMDYINFSVSLKK